MIGAAMVSFIGTQLEIMGPWRHVLKVAHGPLLASVQNMKLDDQTVSLLCVLTTAWTAFSSRFTVTAKPSQCRPQWDRIANEPKIC